MKEEIEKPTIVIQPLEDKFIQDVVNIHQSVLGYTLNSQLGDEHLAFMYQQMSHSPESFVGVAFIEDQPVGLISGTKDLNKTKDVLLKSLNPRKILLIITHLIKNPALLVDVYKGIIIDRPVSLNNESVVAILTTLAIHPHFQWLGIGTKLVFSLETFFKEHNIKNYRLDTFISNQSARQFYKKLGFQEIEIRAGSVVLIKEIKNA